MAIVCLLSLRNGPRLLTISRCPVPRFKLARYAASYVYLQWVGRHLWGFPGSGEIIESVKQYPLIGLSVAVAAGLVLAHFSIQVFQYLFDNFPIAVYWVGGLAAVFTIAFLSNKSLNEWCSRHHKFVAFASLATIVIVFVSLQINDNLERTARVNSFQQQINREGLTIDPATGDRVPSR